MEELDKIKQKINHCISCEFYRTRKQPLAGWFPPGLEILFILDAPYLVDDKHGKVFIGRAGKNFNDHVTNGLELTRKDYGIAYCIKCLPLKDGKRISPTKSSLVWCFEYLQDQIEILRPKIIVTLGFIPFHMFVLKNATIEFAKKNKYHYRKYTGHLYKRKTLFKELDIFVYPMTSPHHWTTNEDVQNQFLRLKSILNDIRQGNDLSDLLKNSPDIPKRSTNQREFTRSRIFGKKRNRSGLNK